MAELIVLNYKARGMSCASTANDEQRRGWKKASSINGKCAKRQILPAPIKTILPKNSSGWFPTLAGVAGIDTIDDLALDGMDLRPLLKGGKGGKGEKREELMIWDFANYGGLVAIRDGKWKALRRDVSKKKPSDWELYDIEADRSEANDLAKQHPEIVERLEKAFIETRIAEPDFPSPLYDR